MGAALPFFLRAEAHRDAYGFYFLTQMARMTQIFYFKAAPSVLSVHGKAI